MQGELEAALATLAGTPIRVALAGRTDTGVHAWGQVASLHFPERERLDTPQIVMRALNGILPRDVAVMDAVLAPEGFHARFSAQRRAYRYLFWSAPAPSPLLSRISLHVKRTLDWDAMSEAAHKLVGTHDFASFAGSGMGISRSDEDRPSTVRTLHLARILHLPGAASPWLWELPAGGETRNGALVALDLVGNAFLPQMVRNIVGTLLEVGEGKRTVANIDETIRSRDRRTAGPTAKPHGLCLMWVEY